MKRISKDEYYLNIAMAVSKRSNCLKRQYGVVIVKNDEIISTGYNGAPRGDVNCCDKYEVCPRANVPHNTQYDGCHSVHAEQNALLSARRSEMIGASLYITGTENETLIGRAEPCPICDRMIRNAGIKHVITWDNDGKTILTRNLK